MAEKLSEALSMVAWRVPVNNKGRLMFEYTERLPFEPDADAGIKVRGEPEPLYAASPATPDAALTCDEQFALATRLAGDLGYSLVSEPSYPDTPHDNFGGPAPDAAHTPIEVTILYRIGEVAGELQRMGKPFSLDAIKAFIPTEHHHLIDALIPPDAGRGEGDRP